MGLFIFIYVLFCIGFGVACGNEMERDKLFVGVVSALLCPAVIGDLVYNYLKSNIKPQ